MSDSSSSVARRPDTLRIALERAGRVAPLPAAFRAGRDLDLLAPLRFVDGTEASPELPCPKVDRAALAAALADANAAYGHPAAAALARRLADPSTRVIVTGQQPGLFGGPLYSLVKAIGAQLWAEKLSAAGRPAVAVFWVATEDHDWAEMSHAVLTMPDGARSFDLGPDPAPLLPAGMRTFGEPLRAVHAALAAAYPEGPAAAALGRLAAWYRPDARFGEAFCRLLAGLLGERCPLLLDSMLPALKTAERPWLERLVDERQAVDAAIGAAEAALAQRGFTPQVTPQPGASPLFLLRGGARRRIVWDGADHFTLRGLDERFPVAELRQTIAENPGVVSPGVLARPAVQDAILGSALFLVGPGELSYLPQAAATHRALGIAAPGVALRPQALLLEAGERRQLEALGEDGPAFLAPDADVERLLARRSGESFVAAAAPGILAAVDALRAPAMDVDSTLERPFAKTREQIERALEAFATKLDAARARRDSTARGRVERLRAAALPRGGVQERVLAVADLPLRFGWDAAQRLLEELTTEPALHVVTLGAAAGTESAQ
ncbi:MAG: bacillithiol biosynthesis cysteine-adding enzyme BshC [Acidobacteriota bacterium]